MTKYVLDIREIDRTQVALAGGKAAGLGELSRIEGVSIPPGLCVTTHAFQQILSKAAVDGQIGRLATLEPDDHDAIRVSSAEIRRIIEGVAIPVDLASAIAQALRRFDDDVAFAVRSSATAEDLPTASFAGQQDTYLNVVGFAAILGHISRCWASLFSDRAVTYRLRNRIDNRKVSMAVVVQQMVFPKSAGILFTADPVSGNRKVAVVEASFGLGEALVSGLTNADSYRVRDGAIVARAVAAKRIAIQPSPSGGTKQLEIDVARQDEPALADAQVVRLVELGRRIEAHFDRPQDIEWCLDDGDFHVVQSRPITTLFPIPEQRDGANHLYVSVGHQQMMTDPLKPLGLAVWQLTTPRPMAEAGGRLFVDVTPMLASLATRETLLATLGKSDPLIRDALQTVLDRGDFIRPVSDTGPTWKPPGEGAAAIPTDPAIVDDLVERTEAAIADLKRELRSKSGSELFDFITVDIKGRKQVQSDPRSLQVVMAGMEAAWWLNEHLQLWLGEKNVADTFTQSAPNNVTSEMGLALLDVADVIRPHAAVVAFLEYVTDDDFLNTLPTLLGGQEAKEAIEAWLDKYGMRCVGEIDITRPRWRERPRMLLPLILGNVRTFAPGAARQRFEQGRLEAERKEIEVLDRLRTLPHGEQKARETKQMIDRVRTFAGYREYPKYAMVSRYFLYKEALLREAERLVNDGVLRDKEDVFYLRFDEFQNAVRTHHVDEPLIRERKDAFDSYQALTPPRVLTSEGETLSGSYRRNDVPAGALVGLAVSSGIVEGRARVVSNIANADLAPGDILVTTFTDPSWTPLFVAIRGLVTEVGGLMTHGAVIAREYGLPAIVGVEDATRLIRDGQRIVVDGTNGWVELIT